MLQKCFTQDIRLLSYQNLKKEDKKRKHQGTNLLDA